MGWSSANEIFDRVAQALVELGITTSAGTALLEELIGVLQSGDWDTEDESLERFSGQPFIVEAFARCGIMDVTDE